MIKSAAKADSWAFWHLRFAQSKAFKALGLKLKPHPIEFSVEKIKTEIGKVECLLPLAKK